jgi:hypothetical protein
MTLTCLAVVELQLVMQYCDLVSLLRLARCSRMILAAASSDFAWRALSPLSLHALLLSRSKQSAVQRAELQHHGQVRPEELSGLLLRFCDLRARYVPTIPRHGLEEFLQQLARLPRVRTLEVGGHAFSADDSITDAAPQSDWAACSHWNHCTGHRA